MDACQPTKESAVLVEINRAEKAVSHLEEIVSDMTTRLQCVSEENTPTGEKTECDKETACCDLAVKIRNIRKGVELQTEILKRRITLLEI